MMLCKTKFVVAASMALAAGFTQAADGSDASIGLTFGSKFKEPGSAAEVSAPELKFEAHF